MIHMSRFHLVLLLIAVIVTITIVMYAIFSDGKVNEPFDTPSVPTGLGSVSADYATAMNAVPNAQAQADDEADVFPALAEVMPDFTLDTSRTDRSGAEGSRSCTLYNVSTDDDIAACNNSYYDFSRFLLNKIAANPSTTSAQRTAIDRIKTFRRGKTNQEKQCKLQLGQGWFQPIEDQGLIYPATTSTNLRSLSRGPASRWPNCYNADGGAAAQVVGAFSDVVQAVHGDDAVVARDGTDKAGYSEVSFKKVDMTSLYKNGDYQNSFACHLPVASPAITQGKFLKLSIDTSNRIKGFTVVDCDTSAVPNLKEVTPNSPEEMLMFRQMFLYVASGRRLLMYAMTYVTANIFQLTVDLCGRITKSTPMNVTYDATQPTQLSLTGNLKVKKSYLLDNRSFTSDQDTANYAELLNRRRAGTNNTSSQLDSALVTRLENAFNANVLSEITRLKNAASSANTCVNINAFGASSHADKLDDAYGYLYISMGNNFAATQDDLNATAATLPPITVGTDGRVNCVSTVGVTDRGYNDVNEALIDVCKTANSTYIGYDFDSKTSSGCRPISATNPDTNEYSYKCASVFPIDANKKTPCMSTDSASARGYGSTEAAATSACVNANQPWGITPANSTGCPAGKVFYSCMSDPSQATSYEGQNIRNTANNAVYKVEAGKLRHYSQLAFDYAKSRTPQPVNMISESYRRPIFGDRLEPFGNVENVGNVEKFEAPRGDEMPEPTNSQSVPTGYWVMSWDSLKRNYPNGFMLYTSKGYIGLLTDKMLKATAHAYPAETASVFIVDEPPNDIYPSHNSVYDAYAAKWYLIQEKKTNNFVRHYSSACWAKDATATANSFDFSWRMYYKPEDPTQVIIGNCFPGNTTGCYMNMNTDGVIGIATVAATSATIFTLRQPVKYDIPFRIQSAANPEMCVNTEAANSRTVLRNCDNASTYYMDSAGHIVSVATSKCLGRIDTPKGEALAEGQCDANSILWNNTWIWKDKWIQQLKFPKDNTDMCMDVYQSGQYTYNDGQRLGTWNCWYGNGDITQRFQSEYVLTFRLQDNLANDSYKKYLVMTGYPYWSPNGLYLRNEMNMPPETVSNPTSDIYKPAYYASLESTRLSTRTVVSCTVRFTQLPSKKQYSTVWEFGTDTVELLQLVAYTNESGTTKMYAWAGVGGPDNGIVVSANTDYNATVEFVPGSLLVLKVNNTEYFRSSSSSLRGVTYFCRLRLGHNATATYVGAGYRPFAGYIKDLTIKL